MILSIKRLCKETSNGAIYNTSLGGKLHCGKGGLT